MATIDLTLAHSPDPDDAFMWWPLTGRIEPPIDPSAIEPARVVSAPAMNTRGVRFVPVACDIEVLNRRAATIGDLDITALSVRTYADVRSAYAITRCGASFGEGYGPRLVCHADALFADALACAATKPTIAIPGTRTTAFLVLSMLLGEARDRVRFVELPFDRIIGEVASGRCDAGLLIHEAQLTFEQAGLRLLQDLGAWWQQQTSSPLPLGINAVKRDLDSRHGPGTLVRVSQLLFDSVQFASDRWDESVDYTMAFAEANALRNGEEPPSRERIDRYCRMYVTAITRDMGAMGSAAIHRLLTTGARLGLCPEPGNIELA